MKKIRIEHTIFLGICGLFLAVACNIDYHRAVNYLFSDEAVYYMMAQSFAYDQDLEYTQKDLVRVYEDGWQVGPQGVFLTKVADFRLTDRSFQQLQQQAIPNDVLVRLRTLKDQNISTQEKFLSAVRQTIGTELTQRYTPLILQAVETGNEKIYYSKSFVYALFLAPWILIFGFKGFLFLNASLLLFMLWMGWLYLQQFNSRSISLLMSMTFFLLSASVIYTFWVTPEIFNMFCITLGMFLWLYQRENNEMTSQKMSAKKKGTGVHRWRQTSRLFVAWLLATPSGRLYLAPIPIAIAAASKLPNALFILPIAVDLIIEGFIVIFQRTAGRRSPMPRMRILGQFRRIWKAFGKLVIISVIFWLLFLWLYGFQHVLTGHFNPYAGDRKTFYGNFPFLTGDDLWEKGIRLSNDDYYEQSFYFEPKIILYNLYYYIVGRFTGIFPYFLCSFLALYYFLKAALSRSHSPRMVSSSRRRMFLLLTIGASIFAYIFMAPSNYQGGGGAFGNRFFLNIYPAFLFLMTGLSSLRPVLISWIIGAVFLAQSLINPFQTSWSPAFHAYRGLFRLLPVELTLVDTLPTNVNPHLMQVFHDETPPFRVYFFDDHAYGMDNSRVFWVRGEETVEFAVRTYEPQDYLVLTFSNGPIRNQVDVEAAGIKQSVIFDVARETKKLVFPLQWSMPYFRTNHIYPVKIRSHRGYIPQFTAGSGLNAVRKLGCRVQISLDSYEIASALRENHQPQLAVNILDPQVLLQQKNIFLRYELALAYQQLNNLPAAERKLKQGEALLPTYQQEMLALCQNQGETCIHERISGEAETNGDLARILQPLIRRYEAEYLEHTTGQILMHHDASNGEIAAFTPDIDPPGFLVYGPFSKYQPGTYQARFRIYRQSSQHPHPFVPGPAMFIEVFDQKQGIIARKAVAPEMKIFADSSPFQEYTLNFDLISPGILEFRVQTTGLARVCVDRIDVYPRLPLQIYQSLAQLSLDRGDSQQALFYGRQLLDAAPLSPEFQILYLRALLQANQWDKVLDLLRKSQTVSEIQTGIASVLFETSALMSKQSFDAPVSFDAPGDPQELQQFLDDLHEKFTPNLSLHAAFEDQAAFVGYDISASTFAPGDHFAIEYVWKALNAMDADYAFFVHFIKKGEWLASETTSKIQRRLGFPVRQMFQQDHEPLNGAYPTSQWIPGELIREKYDVVVPSDLEPGTYEIWIGVWNPLTKTRLHSDGATKIKIGEIAIWPKNGSNG